MDLLRNPFKGVVADVKGRASWYKDDWVAGFRTGFRILAPTMYMFFASALPVIAFGEQLSNETNGILSTVETLASTAICGVIHSFLGGQPLLIVGVAEPTIIMYTYLYNYAKKQPGLGERLYLAWAGWVCIWTAIMLFLLAMINASNVISRFTRVAGELFGMLITVLFLQQAIKGIVSEFSKPLEFEIADRTSPIYQFQWVYVNGLLGVIFSIGLLYTALKTRRARSWLYGIGWLRGFIADYGVPLMVVVWTAFSYALPSHVPSGVPRRLYSPLPWESISLGHWTVAKDLFSVPPAYIFAAIVPALMVAGLYFFDHSVASQLAQQKEFNLKKPSAYHYDILVLGFMVLLCGLLGIPPSNGVLPQSPMHTRSLAVLRGQFLRKKMLQTAKEGMVKSASSLEIYGKMQEVFIQMDSIQNADFVDKDLKSLKDAVLREGDEEGKLAGEFDPRKHIEAHLPVRVNEQRLSNLLQSLLVGCCVGAMPVIKMIPTSVLWGYFAYMAIDSLPGNQFWERIRLLFVGASRRYKIFEGPHASFVESVPSRTISVFTIFQIVYLLICFGTTWIPIAGILFPLPFFLMILIRQHVLPKFFEPNDLRELDAAEYEELEGVHLEHTLEDDCSIPGSCDNRNDAEILDELTTNRGEVKHRAVTHREEKHLQVHSNAVQPRLRAPHHAAAHRTVLCRSPRGRLPDMAAPFIYRPSSASAGGDGDGGQALFKAATDGNLGRLKGIVKSLTKDKGDTSAIFSFNTGGLSVLHIAASFGHLEVCKYLVEELKGDVNAPGYGPAARGMNAFMASAQSGDVPIVKYFLDRGGDLMKVDDKGRTVLHHAVSAGCCKVTEFLLSKGVPVDVDSGRGTPLFFAATNEQDKTLKILLDHHANPNIVVGGMGDPLCMALTFRSLKCMKLLIKAGANVDGKGCAMTPLVFATARGGYTKFIHFLLKAGADPNIPDDLGRLPVEIAALRDCREEVEMLFPLTSPLPNVPKWTIEGVISHAKTEARKPMEQRDRERRKDFLKSQADTAFKQKEYKMASGFYDLAIAHGESATLYANRSLCKLLMGNGEDALSDALRCRMLRPKWGKACYRQAAAHMLLKEYKQACDALLDAQKLDPGNVEIENELRKARELMKNPSGGREQ
ncbi:boron transporter 4-like [Lolium rigidum]|uniref:boron transporter 4-like n=1 Tax=Lolium rigidum TaxID=89674 RepID=UPI001F5D4471|nr:boron transporter 4-like [Lolium rigidum]